ACGTQIAAIEGQLRTAEQRKTVRTRLVEEIGRFDESPLPATQFSETHEGIAGHRRTAGREFLTCRAQLLFGLEPRPAPQADGGILRAAHGKERTQPPFHAERLEPRAPLHGAVIVANSLARRDQVAA